ncbi:hypothetical protein LCM20_02910 [Halobacillus litoralis]|uniref:hypothetical protein n=1 Tax=Halobacillus litoralis TaxID=45668 RepID=UPI001CD2C813|nr:hypothetical protein [Halobacillus litoralis]MCA0969541.1 hypothetical protein [Halobacillus litoralis]
MAERLADQFDAFDEQTLLNEQLVLFLDENHLKMENFIADHMDDFSKLAQSESFRQSVLNSESTT